VCFRGSRGWLSLSIGSSRLPCDLLWNEWKLRVGRCFNETVSWSKAVLIIVLLLVDPWASIPVWPPPPGCLYAVPYFCKNIGWGHLVERECFTWVSAWFLCLCVHPRIFFWLGILRSQTYWSRARLLSWYFRFILYKILNRYRIPTKIIDNEQFFSRMRQE